MRLLLPAIGTHIGHMFRAKVEAEDFEDSYSDAPEVRDCMFAVHGGCKADVNADRTGAVDAGAKSSQESTHTGLQDHWLKTTETRHMQQDYTVAGMDSAGRG